MLYGGKNSLNILYISKIDGRPWIGPTYSVPKQIEAQSKIDNVFWYNICSDGKEEGRDNLNNWRKLSYYKDLSSYPECKINALPSPFNKPDLIVVEQGYPFAFSPIRNEIMHTNIPYIVIPRGELTELAQNKHRLKKKIGNFILGYKSFMNKAVAIHCLTQQEKKETSEKWNENKFVLPNGVDLPSNIPIVKKRSGIRCVSIGRIEPYQKGLDLLIEACSTIIEELKKNHVSITLYGSNQENKLDSIKQFVEEKSLSDIIIFKNAVFGKEKQQVLLNSDVFLMPSRFEGHPTGLLEALSYGLPCVATTGSNMRKEIDDNDAGWTADNEVESIKDALISMISEKELIDTKSKNARILAEKYDWNSIAKSTHDVYCSFVK